MHPTQGMVPREVSICHLGARDYTLIANPELSQEEYKSSTLCPSHNHTTMATPEQNTSETVQVEQAQYVFFLRKAMGVPHEILTCNCVGPWIPRPMPPLLSSPLSSLFPRRSRRSMSSRASRRTSSTFRMICCSIGCCFAKMDSCGVAERLSPVVGRLPPPASKR